MPQPLKVSDSDFPTSKSPMAVGLTLAPALKVVVIFPEVGVQQESWWPTAVKTEVPTTRARL